MSDKNQDIQKVFADIVNKDVDELIDRQLSDKEVGEARILEVSDLLDDGIAFLQDENERMQDMNVAVDTLDQAEQGLSDIERIAQIKKKIQG